MALFTLSVDKYFQILPDNFLIISKCFLGEIIQRPKNSCGYEKWPFGQQNLAMIIQRVRRAVGITFQEIGKYCRQVVVSRWEIGCPFFCQPLGTFDYGSKTFVMEVGYGPSIACACYGSSWIYISNTSPDVREGLG